METATLAHHGVKGMKWGVRKDRKSSGGGILGRLSKRKAPTASGMRDVTFKQKPKHEDKLVVDKEGPVPTGGLIRGKRTAGLSDKQLQATINRLKMDAEYAKLTRTGFQKFLNRVGDKLSAEAAGFAAGLVSKQMRSYLDSAILNAKAGKSKGGGGPNPSGPKPTPNLPAPGGPSSPSGGGGSRFKDSFKRRWKNMSAEFKRTWDGPPSTTTDATTSKIYDQYGGYFFERGSVIDENGRIVKPRKR